MQLMSLAPHMAHPAPSCVIAGAVGTGDGYMYRHRAEPCDPGGPPGASLLAQFQGATRYTVLNLSCQDHY